MTIPLIAFFLNIIAAFNSALTGHMILCVIDIVVAVLMALSDIICEGQLLNRSRSLE